MNKKETLALLLVALTLSLTATAIACSSTSFPSIFAVGDASNTQRLAMYAPVIVVAGLQGNGTTLNQPTRMEIYTYVKANPGVHFRGICSGLDLSVGVVQYHLEVLERAGLLTARSDGQSRRFFAANTYDEAETKLIALLRHETTGNILRLLSQEKSALHKDLAHQVGVSSQALTWQMHHLKSAGLFKTAKEGMIVKYMLSEETAGKVREAVNCLDNCPI